MTEIKRIHKMLVANRGEIAIRILRACTELNIETVAIYSKEDTPSLHRYKADESYLIGEDKPPIDAYLAIDEIITLAKQTGVDAIHPGYGFLSESIELAQRCEQEGLIFIGPDSAHLSMFGDKVNARAKALDAGLPVIPGTDGPVTSVAEVEAFAETHGFPLIIKASLGGGGRGMRIINQHAELKEGFERAQSEAKSVFGDDAIYVEKYIEDPKHIEVQVMGDTHGQIVHLHERDCSIQRRHQKVVEIAPSKLPVALKDAICASAVQLAEYVRYVNAGTVEFLVSGDAFYFIEVNPRIQVEHTVTEMITGVDIVQSQIKIAQGCQLHDETLGMAEQTDITTNGYAIQSRVTTEDPLNEFMPDTGRIMVYRSSGGFGVRLDAGDGFQGAVVSPYYDSLLVKVSTWALTFKQAAQKMTRNLKEFRIRGIKTNIPFLINVMTHDQFLSGEYDTHFIDATPELFIFPVQKDRGTKLLTYIAEMTVNGVKGVEKKKKPVFSRLHVPRIDQTAPIPQGPKQLLETDGPDAVATWLKEQNEVLLTDTTFRDAHQSLLATRVRTNDLKQIAEPMARLLPELFSVEMWGGATFDVSYRFLREDPWQRLLSLREKMPNMLFQMLLRASNGVGYKNYPDNLIRRFVEESAQAGIDVFRIFDSLNWLENMTGSIEAVRENGKLAEASICYTGNVLDKGHVKYDLDYYKHMARELTHAGAHILGIKDMAGLLKPEAAYQLIAELKETVDIPIHLHTHDTSGNGIYTYARAIDAGVDAVDVAAGALAGSTSQPSAQSLYHALDGHTRQPDIAIDQYEAISKYWSGVRHYYQDFENGMLSPHTEVYFHEMPGGQYSNLQQQAKAVGLGERWEEVKVMFNQVNNMFGDIVKVTPSSKIVGDMALFMVQNDLTEQDIYERGQSIDFPASVVSFFQGYIGQPYGGFPKKLQEIVLKGEAPVTERPGALLEPIDFTQLEQELYHKLDREVTIFDILAYALYPDVFMSYHQFTQMYADVSVLDTPTYFYGMRLGEEIEVEIEQGKTLFIRLLSISQPRSDGVRHIYFELNGQSRDILIKDRHVETDVQAVPKADKEDPKHIGATMPGTVVKCLCSKGDQVDKGDHLLVTEAMKMETTIQAPFSGVIKSVYVDTDTTISANDLLVEFE